jgi:aspartyl-tRNA(Asn)/glutamyl-tRNA(Gln) amidotransferase subunit C
MKISRQEIEEMARLSHLELTGAQFEQYENIFNHILKYAKVLKEVDTQDTEPTINVYPLQNVMRKDQTLPSLPRDTALALSPAAEDGYFKVAKIMEG